MTNLVPLNFDNRPVRVFDRDGQPWFVLSDVCSILGLTNPTMAAKPLDDDERSKISLGGQGEAIVVSLPGILTLIVRCREAMKKGTVPYRMRKWITTDVVPTIMRTGQYGTPVPALDLRDPAVLHRLLLDHTKNAMEAEQRAAELAPKAEALDLLSQAAGALCITDAAKGMGVQPRRLFSWLEANHWTYRRGEGGHWVAYQAKIDSGMLEHKGTRLQRPGMPDRLVEQVMVTPKGLTRLATVKAGA